MAGPTRFEGLPEIIYGTAFKFDKSTKLVEAALKVGFRAIDTAGSKSAYREALVGEAIAAALASGSVKRSELYIQTKFSPHKLGKDPALYPYDTTNSIPEQVAESIDSSLTNLGVDYIDCLVLHSLYANMEDTLIAWKAMESLVPSKVGSLGVSNADLDSLRHLCDSCSIKPVAVQNRFTSHTVDRPNPEFPPDLPYPIVPWDRDVRQYCHHHGIAYAPWGLLWSNFEDLDGDEKVLEKAGIAVGVSKQIACFALMRSLGGCQISLLCGTTNEERMRETLDGLAKFKNYLAESEEHRESWGGYVKAFRLIVEGYEG